ncbi:MAG TPA: peptidylprolyl isomerase, partial [Steroidobacteraceae bacterium]|nr:peptidylprolyl isomerase [Steroidobacteraceae bacterium]
MLQSISDTITRHSWLKYALLGALAFIFAVWGAYGIATLRFGSSNNVAKVDGEAIPTEDVRRALRSEESQWEQRLGSTELPPVIKSSLENEVIEGFVRNALLTQRTRSLGYRVSDTQLMQAIRAFPAFQLEGQYSAQVAQARLAQAGISEEEFERELRQDLQRAELENGIRDSDFVTRAEAQRLAALDSEERQVRYLVLPLERFAPQAPLSEAEVEAYYKQHQAQFMTPETVNVRYAQLTVQQVAAQTQIADADVRDYYDKNKARYVVPERRDARHILIAVGGKRDDASALKRAQEVLAKLKAGGDFAALAKQYSDDPGSASKGGELGWSERGDLVKPFADALFSMGVNDVRGPVKTEYGYHIIQLEGIQPGQARTLEQARPDIQAQLAHDRATDRFGDIQEQIEQKLDQPDVSLESLAKEFGMQLGDVPNYQRGIGGGALGDSRDVQDAVFGDSALAEHRIGGPILIGDDRLVLVRDVEHHPAAPKPLAEVRGPIEVALRRQHEEQAAQDAARSAIQKLSSGASFDQVAQQLGVSPDAARYIGRTDPSVPAEIRDLAFNTPKPDPQRPQFRSLSLKGGGVAVLEVSAQRAGPVSAPNAQLQASTRREAAERAGEQ